MNIKFLFLTGLFLYCCHPGNAQQKKYTWSEDVCSYTGLYDPQKTSVEELKATTAFLMINGYVDYDVAVSVEKAKKLDPELLTRAYDSAKAMIQNLRLPPTPFWAGVVSQFENGNP